MTQILKAFIARSFLPEDERRLRPTLDFLETFRSIGFVCQSAEPAEVESVSEKVRRIIDESDVFIGFFTKRHPVYELKPGIRGALDLALGKLRPKFWSAPAWVLQESGYALKSLSLRKLILLREPDVEVFGLQGDLEYIPFVPERFAEAQAKLNEMILGLVAEAAGTEVKLVLSQREDRKLEAAVATTQDDKGQGAEPQQPKNEAAAPELFDHYFAMLSASRAKDLRSLEEAWKYGVRLIEEGRARDVDVVRWESWYQGFRFDAGAADALEALRGLQAKNPTREEPVSAVAECLYESKEYEQASELFLKAAELSTQKAWYLIKAAESCRELRRYESGIRAAIAALSDARGEVRTDAISVLYQLLRESGQPELAYGAAELALQENPKLGIRFKVALDYHRDNIENMALHHFKFLHERDKNDTSSLHNIALICADSKMPITGVDRYKEAFAQGETLSAANLGFMYLDCGMADEARTVIGKAMQIEGHEDRVEKCLAEITQRRQDEKKKESDLLASATENRKVLVLVGKAFHEPAPPVDGVWKFSFGEIALALKGGVIAGSAKIRSMESSLRALLGDAPVQREEIKEHIFSGKLTGSVCRFTLTSTDITDNNTISANAFSGLFFGKPSTTTAGFLVFGPKGTSAAYIELKDGRLGKPQRISKVR